MTKNRLAPFVRFRTLGLPIGKANRQGHQGLDYLNPSIKSWLRV